MVKVTVYVEGGGKGKNLRIRCRHGFREFFRKAGFEGRMPAVVPCGSRNDAFDDFRTALRTSGSGNVPLLLVDSEGPVKSMGRPWAHLTTRDKWSKPRTAKDDQAHLMVQCMEAWTLADKDGLARFFGQGFTRSALPNRPDVENIKKSTVEEALRRATRNARNKGEYSKGKHSFELLAQIDPQAVREAAPHADRLLRTLEGFSATPER